MVRGAHWPRHAGSGDLGALPQLATCGGDTRRRRRALSGRWRQGRAIRADLNRIIALASYIYYYHKFKTLLIANYFDHKFNFFLIARKTFPEIFWQFLNNFVTSLFLEQPFSSAG